MDTEDLAKVRAICVEVLDGRQTNAAAAEILRVADRQKIVGEISEALDIQGAVSKALKAAAESRQDPWRNVVHFLAGLGTFCLGVIVGIFNALSDSPTSLPPLVASLLGGVLAWMALAAGAATACGIWAQLARWHYRNKVAGEGGAPCSRPFHRGIVMAIPSLFGLVAVAYCVRAGTALLTQQQTLLGWGALKALWF